MRRAILAVTLGGVLLTSAACDSAAKPVASAPSVAAPTPTPTVSAADYSADTRKVCDNVQKIFDNDIKPFGAALGKMIVFKDAKLSAEVTNAQKAATAQLKTVATKLRKATKDAEDPAVMMAGESSAAKLDLSAADKKLYDQVKNEKDVDRFIDGHVGDWLTPISGYCA
jgi:hypothetical protein